MDNFLVDSSFLFALYDADSTQHDAVVAVTKTRTANLIIPYVVLTEVAFLFKRAGGVPGLIFFLNKLTEVRLQLEPVTFDDLERAREISAQYPKARFDFVDVCLMALSERLNIRHICTLDQRDFSIFHPKHCEYLEILP